MAFIVWVPFLRPWWWIFLPAFLVIELQKLYMWWIRWDYAYAKEKWVIVEIIPPKEVLVPLKAMEDVFTVLWAALYDEPNWREQWCEGSLPDAPGWMSWEIASVEGEIHFYARMPEALRSSVEATLYNHFPALEIKEVPDYAKVVPQNLPNQEWDVYGEDYILNGPSAYPIKTYEKFFEPQGEKISAEEKRIDPIGSLLESMSQLGPHEHFWLQFVIMTMTKSDANEPGWRGEAQKIISKIIKRPEKKPHSFGGGILDELFDAIFFLIRGSATPGAEVKPVKSVKSEEGEREMVLTPGEREVVTEIENKLKKPVFRTKITGMYVAKREHWNADHKTIARLYFSHFNAVHLNFIRFSTVTRPKVHYIMRKRRVFVRARRMFRNYILRFPTLFPNRREACAILNTEELATLFHFPIKIGGLSLPTMARVDSKKTGPPPNLPME